MIKQPFERFIAAKVSKGIQIWYCSQAFTPALYIAAHQKSASSAQLAIEKFEPESERIHEPFSKFHLAVKVRAADRLAGCCLDVEL